MKTSLGLVGRILQRSPTSAPASPHWCTWRGSARLPPAIFYRRDHPAMNRRAFLCGLTGTLAAPLATEAQQAARIYRVGVLTPGTRTALSLIHISEPTRLLS